MMIHVLVVGIVLPPTDSHKILFDESTSHVQLMCSLSINISSSVTIIWLQNGIAVMKTFTQTGNTTTLLRENPKPSDAGVYQCVFDNTYYQWIGNRSITLELCK